MSCRMVCLLSRFHVFRYAAISIFLIFLCCSAFVFFPFRLLLYDNSHCTSHCYGMVRFFACGKNNVQKFVCIANDSTVYLLLYLPYNSCGLCFACIRIVYLCARARTVGRTHAFAYIRIFFLTKMN